MPKTIKMKCFILFFAVFTVIVGAEDGIDFLDCGSYLEIENVTVTSCLTTPCVFSPGSNFSVQLLLGGDMKQVDDDLVAEAYLRMFGTKWPLTVAPMNPCGSVWACPVVEVSNLTFTADIQMRTDVALRPAYVELILRDQSDDFQAICVEFSIQIQ